LYLLIRAALLGAAGTSAHWTLCALHFHRDGHPEELLSKNASYVLDEV
jgi:hypothetical protein